MALFIRFWPLCVLLPLVSPCVYERTERKKINERTQNLALSHFLAIQDWQEELSVSVS